MKTKITNAIILIVVLMCISFVFSGCKKKETLDEVLLKYMEHIPQQEYEEMYKMIDVKASGSIEKDNFIERNSKIYEGIEISNFKVEILEVDKKELAVTYKNSFDTLSNKISFENKVQFVESEEGYKIIWKDSLIVPNLESTDKVRISVNKAIRGEILDRNGYVLAGQGEAFSVGLVPEKIEDDENTFAKLSEILEVDVDTIHKKLDASWVRADLFVPIKLLSTEDKEMHKEELLAIPGVMIKTQIVRTYSMGEAAAHLVGYVQNVNAEDLEKRVGEGYDADSVIGRSGIEALYEKELKGKNGYSIEIKTADGDTKEVLTYNDVEHGKNIQLTIDYFLQQDLYETFKEDKSCSVALNPETGEVLALVSTPTYDNNDFILGMSSDKWDTLNNDENKPLLNRFRQTYAPGSTFKPITASIGLQNNVFTADEDFGSEGHEWQKEESWGSYKITTLKTYEPVVLKNAIMYSDNIYFAKVALKIGNKSFAKALDILGFNKKMPFEITMGKSKYSNTEQIETEIQLADSGYGQGQMLVNPLHLATLYTAYEKARNAVRKIDFDDMLVLTFRLFQSRPDVLGLWQKKYKYILIDEFQDINQVQYDVIRMLAAPENNLFIVGDDDQSIYRFRGAKPEIMLDFPKDYPGVRQILLNINYRSTKAIVSGAARVICHNKERYPKQIVTENVQGATVHIQEVLHPVEESRYVVREIQKAKERGVPVSEIAVLFRTNVDARAMVETCIEYNLPFRMKEHFPNLYEHFVARDWITYMKMALGDRKRNTFLKIMNRPNRYIGRDSVEQGEISFESLRKYYAEKDWMLDRIDQLEVDLRIIGRMAPYGAIQYIRKHIGYDDFLKEYAYTRRIRKEDLEEVTREIEERAKEFRTIEDWFAHIEDYTAELKQQETYRYDNADAVSFMTMHGAKGLEFDTVFVIGANENIIPYKKAKTPEEIEEERRLFYVAMTRAKKKLVISYTKERNGKKMEPSRFVEEVLGKTK